MESREKNHLLIRTSVGAPFFDFFAAMLRVKDVGTVPFPRAVAARRACRWAGIENWGRERVVELIRSIFGSVVLFRRWCFVGMFGGVRRT